MYTKNNGKRLTPEGSHIQRVLMCPVLMIKITKLKQALLSYLSYHFSNSFYINTACTISVIDPGMKMMVFDLIYADL